VRKFDQPVPRRLFLFFDLAAKVAKKAGKVKFCKNTFKKAGKVKFRTTLSKISSTNFNLTTLLFNKKVKPLQSKQD